MLHKDFRRNGLTTKDFQHFNLEKPARFGSHQKSVYQGHSCSTIYFFLHWRCSLALQTAATWSSRSKETIIQPTPHDFIYRAPKGRFPILIVHSLVFLPSSSTRFWWLLILTVLLLNIHQQTAVIFIAHWQQTPISHKQHENILPGVWIHSS